jgi:hypothetical protein
MPPFRFVLSTDHTPVAPATPLWKELLPTSRRAAGGLPGEALPNEDAQVTYGGYFSALRNALAADHCAALCGALSRIIQRSIRPECIEVVEIQLLKHGHFYHPACVVVLMTGVAHHLALNVALSPDGIALLPKETAALDALARQKGLTSVPRVLAQGYCALEGRLGQWFLAPWFEGFHEFHLTSLERGRQAVTVWDGAPNPTVLNNAQADALLEGAARIITTAVNPHTLANIFPWHHAAGDFVVRLGAGGHPQVRLITVRDYQPLLPPTQGEDGAGDDAPLERLLYALLLLVIQTAVRLRVDRLDGVGEIAIYPDSVVGAICRGCLDGIGHMCRRWNLPPDLELAAREYLSTPSLEELSQLSAAVAGGFASASPERKAFAPYLKAHVKALHVQLQDSVSTRQSH